MKLSNPNLVKKEFGRRMEIKRRAKWETQVRCQKVPQKYPMKKKKKNNDNLGQTRVTLE